MHLADIIPDANAPLAFEPEELGLRMLPVLARWSERELLDLRRFLDTIRRPEHSSAPWPYPPERQGELQEAIAEAWAGLRARRS